MLTGTKSWLINELKEIGVYRHPEKMDKLEKHKTSELRKLLLSDCKKAYEKHAEQIIVFKRNDLFGANDELAFNGFSKLQHILNNLTCEEYSVMKRGYAEKNPDFKQPIPYVAVMNRSGEIFTYSRLVGGGEKRLHGKKSIGVGGHMNVIAKSGNFLDEIVHNSVRELNEELNVKIEDEIMVLGFINDDTNEVGKVHFGILLVIEVDDASVKEHDTMVGEFLTVEDLMEQKDSLESWSQIAVEQLKYILSEVK